MPRPEVAMRSRDELFTVLSNRRRRRVLYYLLQHDVKQVDLRTLVDVLSEWEYGESVDDLSWKQRKRVYTALHQSHLPKLAEAGAIEYERSRGQVTPTEEIGEYRIYLEYVPADDIPWYRYYLGLTAIAATLTGLVWLSVFPFSNLSGLALSTILVSVFAVSAIVHAHHSRWNQIEMSELFR
ncbi:hypothetical protein EA462_10505 [Natrarchaeobius halalkaliphilus]|uniref:DUF7344 domain-containing protein n=2 Tax=Natrarchaeobius halalkaliphilus TaxID=1679091 RepID=A0A3N6LQK4_9EURY|nr:hypothetical protein EA462_10505 [Natrarchaeobius halalkaliphilus]